MEEENAMVPKQPLQTDQREQKPKISPYDLLMRQSRKLGGAATKTLDITKEFLKKDVSVLHPDAILFGKPTKQPSVLRTPRSIHQLAEESHQILAAAKTVWLPVNFFPDSVILDRSKLTIIRRTFFWTSEVITMRVEDILNVTCGTNPFFGSITVSTRVYNSTDHYEIDFFWRRDAIMLKEIIQGYMIALHNNVETNHLSLEELSETLLELGRDTNM